MYQVQKTRNNINVWLNVGSYRMKIIGNIINGKQQYYTINDFPWGEYKGWSILVFTEIERLIDLIFGV